MPKIVDRRFFDGAEERIARLHLGAGLLEVEGIIEGFSFEIEEKRNSNGAAGLRRLFDEGFVRVGGWLGMKSGGVDWTKCWSINGAKVCLGIEVQVSARSDMMIVDVDHLRDAIESGAIDAGIIIVSSDRLSTFLTDRVGSFSTAVKAVGRARAEQLPLVILVVEHDSVGMAQPKQIRRKKQDTDSGTIV